MLLARCTAVAVTFASAVVASAATAGPPAGLEVYPGPGVDTYRSSLYAVEVSDGSSWLPAYVYGFSHRSVCHRHPGTFPTVNLLTFGTAGPVDVRVTRTAGPITSVDVSPHSRNIPAQVRGGRAVLTLNQNQKVWITVNGDDASVEGITIVDSPGYNFFGGGRSAYSVKLLPPWFYSTDGFQGVSHVDQSFVFVGDNAFFPIWAGVQNDDVTITSSFAGTTNNSVFSGGYWGSEAIKGYTALASDIDIKTYNNDDWVSGASPLLAAAFQIFVDNSDPRQGYSNQTYQNIRIEGNLSVPFLELRNLVYPWGGGPRPPLGNSYNLVFSDITVTGTQKYRSEIEGWDASNGFHGVVLENVTLNGTTVDESNVARYFDINGDVWGLRFTRAAPCCVALPVPGLPAPGLPPPRTR